MHENIKSLVEFLSEIAAESFSTEDLSVNRDSCPLPLPGAFYILSAGHGSISMASGVQRRISPGEFIYFRNFLYENVTELQFRPETDVQLILVRGFIPKANIDLTLKKIFSFIENYECLRKIYVTYFNSARAQDFFYALGSAKHFQANTNQSIRLETDSERLNLLVLNGKARFAHESPKIFISNGTLVPHSISATLWVLEPINLILSSLKIDDQISEKSLLSRCANLLKSAIRAFVSRSFSGENYFQREESTCGLEVVKSILHFYDRDFITEQIKERVVNLKIGIRASELQSIITSYSLEVKTVGAEVLQRPQHPVVVLSNGHYIALLPRGNKWELIDPLGLRELITASQASSMKTDSIYVIEDKNQKSSDNRKQNSKTIARETRSIFLRVLSNEKNRLIALFLLTLFGSLLTLAPVIVIQFLVDFGLKSGNALVLFALISAGILLGISTNAIGYIKERLTISFANVFDVHVSVQLISKILSLDLYQFYRRTFADYNLRFGSIATLREFAGRSFANILFNTLTLFVLLIYLSTRSMVLGSLVLFFIPTLFFILRNYQKSVQLPLWTSYYLQRREQNQMLEFLDRFLTVKAYGAECFAEKTLHDSIVQNANGTSRLELVRSWSKATFEGVESTFTWVGYGFAMYLGIRGQMTFGECTASIIVLSMILKPVQSLAFIGREIIDARMALSSLDDIFGIQPLDQPSSVGLSEISAQKIELKGISFKYPNDTRWLLKDISFTARPGDRIALVGSNGCGKSTLLRLISGLLTPSAGEVMIDDKKLTPEIQRKFISYQPQDAQFFSGSILNNIQLGMPSTSSRLSAHDLLNKFNLSSISRDSAVLPDMNLTNGEEFLSGGERQKLGLARLLYHSKPIVIADEITSSLDSHSQEQAFTLLSRFCESKIVICTVHDPEALKYFNRIFRVNNGSIEEETSVSANAQFFDPGFERPEHLKSL